MVERPILFSGAMVRACLREVDPKTQTRRVVKPQPVAVWGQGVAHCGDQFVVHARFSIGDDRWMKSPYGAPGDRLWVREAFHAGAQNDRKPPRDIRAGSSIWYEADRAEGHAQPGKLRPGMFMPRWACRLVLEVTGVGVERLQDIDEADAEAEGCELRGANDQHGDERNFVEGYRELWDSLNAKRGYGWKTNPWVWVLTFKRRPQ